MPSDWKVCPFIARSSAISSAVAATRVGSADRSWQRSSASRMVRETSPRIASLSASPLPTPKRKRPSSIAAEVAVACATTAGWMRSVGQVTAVVSGIRSVTAATAPITFQTNGDWPWASFQGW